MCFEEEFFQRPTQSFGDSKGPLMDNVVNRSKRRTNAGWRWLLVCVVYLLAGAVPLAVGVIRPGITGYYRCLFEDMVLYLPFVDLL
jgi:hypothetical protein